MTSILVPFQTKTNNQEPLVAIYCDSQNVFLTKESAKLLLDFANSKGRLIEAKFYYNSEVKNQASSKVYLESLGFICFDVPCLLKNSADNQLIADCLEDIYSSISPDVVIIVSGDGDFAKLVWHLKKLSKKAIVVAQRGNVKQRLRSIADEFYSVDELSTLVSKNTSIQTDGALSDINYDDAVECLIEAIKTAVSKGKRTTYSIIASLMSHSERLPKYKGGSTICKPDGTKFSSFSKFVAAVEKEGKIKLQNEEMLLV